MGNAQPGKEAKLLRETAARDAQFLQYLEGDLACPEVLSSLYLEALSCGSISNVDSIHHILHKRSTIPRKLMDANHVLAVMPENPSFRRRQVKMLQREAAFAVEGLDNFNSFVDMRSEFALRILLAYERMAVRREDQGFKTSHSSREEKIDWLQKVLDGHDPYDMMKQRIEQETESLRAQRATWPTEGQTSFHEHKLVLKHEVFSRGWRCDGKDCKTSGVNDRFCCSQGCDFDLCGPCFEKYLQPPEPPSTTSSTTNSSEAKTIKSEEKTDNKTESDKSETKIAAESDKSSKTKKLKKEKRAKGKGKPEDDEKSTPRKKHSEKFEKQVLDQVDTLPEISGIMGLLGALDPKEKNSYIQSVMIQHQHSRRSLLGRAGRPGQPFLASDRNFGALLNELLRNGGERVQFSVEGRPSRGNQDLRSQLRELLSSGSPDLLNHLSNVIFPLMERGGPDAEREFAVAFGEGYADQGENDDDGQDDDDDDEINMDHEGHDEPDDDDNHDDGRFGLFNEDGAGEGQDEDDDVEEGADHVLVALALPPANEPNDFIVVERASSSIEAKCEDIEMREMNHSVNGRGLALDLRSSDSQPSDPFGAEGKTALGLFREANSEVAVAASPAAPAAIETAPPLSPHAENSQPSAQATVSLARAALEAGDAKAGSEVEADKSSPRNTGFAKRSEEKDKNSDQETVKPSKFNWHRANFEPKALEAIDRKFQAHKLLNILVEEAFREAEECLMPGGADALSSTPSPSPATRLLALLQRHFFLQAFSTDIDSRTDALVHVQDFLSRAALLLSALAAQNLPDSRAFPAWTALLQASVIGHVLPSVVVVVQLITGRGQEVSYPNTMDRPRRFNLLKRSFTSLEQIVLALDVLSASCPKSAAAETKLLSLGPLSAAPVVVETPHHCMANSEHVVSIQGATHLSLLFDPRCATESGDRLQVLNAEGAPVCPALSGDSRRESSRWPKLPIIVEGNTTTLKFVKNESSHERPSGLPPRWGFRVVISGLRCSTEGVKSESNWLKIQQNGKPLYENLSEEKIIELETPASLNKPPVPRVKPGSDLSTLAACFAKLDCARAW